MLEVDRSRGSAPIVATLSMVLLVACATTDGYHSEDAPSQEKLRSLLVLPVSFDFSLAQQHITTDQFDRGTRRLSKTLLQYLEACGHEVTPLSRSETMLEWQAAQVDVGGIWADDGNTLVNDRYASARENLARRVLAHHEADGVVMAGLLVREGRYVGHHLRWDDVSRPIHLEQSNNQAYITGVGGGDIATSVRVTVFDSMGTRVFQGYGGIEPIIEYRYIGGGVMSYSSGSMTRHNRTDLFQNESLIWDSIRVAFAPLIKLPKAPET